LRSKIFWKILGAYFLIIFLFLAVSFAFLKSRLSENIVAQNERHLDQVWSLAQDSLENANLTRFSLETVDPLVDRLSKGIDVRITVIDRDGKVLGDSEVSGKALAELENHRHRPEVEQAFATGYGKSVRYSATVRVSMMYIAMPFHDGVLRVAMPLANLDKSLRQLRRMLWLGLLVGAVAAFLTSLVLARHFSVPLRDFTRAVSQMAQGKWNVRVAVKGDDELASLSRGINDLASKIEDLVQKISEEKNQLKVILDGMVEGVMVLDAEGRILLTNPAFRRIFSVDAAPEGRTPLELVRNAELQELVQEILSKKSAFDREIKIQRGLVQQIMVHATPLRMGDAEDASVLVFYDITNLRRLENMRRDFVANVSHELKTPLSAIKGYTETLLEGALKDEENALKFLQIIDHNANRLHRLIQDLLDLSRIESASYKLELEPIDVESLTKELKATFQKELEAKRIAFEVPISGVEEIWADESALRQILSNLIDNAIKYSNSDGFITLRIERLGTSIRFGVEDTGPGIAPQHLSRVFERFYRVDSSRSRSLGGTGLGLSIVKHLVQLHGGEVWAESPPGSGASFYFTLPQKEGV